MKLEHWIIVVFLALCAGMVGVFAAGSWSASHPPKTASTLHDLVHHDLELTDEQNAALEVIERRFATRKAELEADLRQANRALAEAMEADKTYSPAVQAAIDEFHTAMGELQKVTIEHVFEMREILTEEQAIVFDAEVVRALTEL
ncbi:MAG TPA: heavy metal resistance protein [Hyphomonas sp.]|uniref:Spy/CpxP family protein refolding chaperone n=1 Tax=uncultured Hyphomonas sp. TaxID=225298 RepID=UPI000C6A158B|nr:heavy metal resistance protein [Hyphomonadaceae bacterium]HBL93800.1 heavy metal resistance protein [Hyphomonas sp.]HCJ18780.1 heavy metal resistance protein [Hyphomonas sp.]|tara:strand:+ start:32282 stop:32716 length:435 start_codon:yes stop_codon:yes gene_type:complete